MTDAAKRNPLQTLLAHKRELIVILALVSASCILRIIYLLNVKDNPLLTNPRLDALFHDTWALSIANGNILGDTVYFRAPLYAYTLGLVYAVFGHDYLIVRILQHLLGIVSVVLVYALGRKCFDIRTSALGALLVGVNPMILYFEGQLLFESLLICLSLLWLLLIVKAVKKPGTMQWFLVGAGLGLLSITRPPLFAIGIVLVLLFALTNRKKLHGQLLVRASLSLLAGLSFVVLPVTLRNYVVGNDFILIASQGGVNFYIGNNPYADGISSSMPGRLGPNWENRDETYYVEKAIGHKPTDSEESAFWYAEAFGFIKEQPLSFLQLLLKKAYLFWNHTELPNNLNFNTFKKYSPILDYNPFGFWLIGPFALLGIGLTVWRTATFRRNHAQQVLVYFTLFFWLTTILFFVCDRFRVPLVPILCIFSAYGLMSLVHELQRKHFKIFAQMVFALSLFALLVNSNAYSVNVSSPVRDYVRLGIIALNEGRHDEAMNNFHKAIDEQPAFPNLRQNIALAEWGKGNVNAAIGWFHEELKLNPGSFGCLTNLAQIYYERRTIDSAVYYASAAIESKPYLPPGYIWLAKGKLLQGNLSEAESILVRGSHACDPKEFVYGEFLIGNIVHQKGDLKNAENWYRSVLQRLNSLGKNQQPLYEPEFDYALEQKVGEGLYLVQAKSYYGLGLIFLARQALDSAVVFFTLATNADPQFGDAYANLGVALLHLRRIDEAETALFRSTQLNPNQYLYWFNYGNVLENNQKYRSAIDAFERSLSLNPGFQPAKDRLTQIKQNF